MKSKKSQSYYSTVFQEFAPPRFNGVYYSNQSTLLDVAKDKISRAAKALGFSEQQKLEMIELVVDIWGIYDNYKIKNPLFHSFGATEGAPIEFQICWDKLGPSIRFGSDSFSFDQSLDGKKRAFYETTKKISKYEGVDCEGSFLMEKYFKSGGRFGYGGHVVQWRKDEKPEFKIYFVNQPDDNDVNLEEALHVLNVQEAWNSIKKHFEGLGLNSPKCGALSLDMKNYKTSRAKIYIAHDGHTVETIGQTSKICKSYKEGAFENAIHAILGLDVEKKMPPVTYFAFDPSESIPTSSLIFLSLFPNVENDSIALNRLKKFINEKVSGELDFVKNLEEVILAFSHKPLEISKTLNFLAYVPEKQFSLNIGPGIFD